MITYNQEKLLPLALNSLFNQSIFPYEVIIGDDCSTDATWDVIQQYFKRYPSIIKPIRNQKNLGIFGNFNKMMKMPTGDIVSCLSGDDLYKPGIFDAFNKAIKDNNLNPQSENFIIISNAIDLYPSGKEVVYSNYNFRNKNLFKLKIRYALNFRDTGFSISLFKKINSIREDLGYLADWLYCIDQLVKCDKFVFINKPFPVYRIGVGAVSKSKSEDIIKSKIKVIDYIKNNYKSLLDKYDVKYLNKDMLINEYILDKTFLKLMKMCWHILLNINNYSDFSILKKDLTFMILSCGGYVLRKLKLR